MFLRSLSVLLVALALYGCSSGAPEVQQTPIQHIGVSPLSPVANLPEILPTSYAKHIQEIAIAPVPEGVEPQLFELLRSELLRVIETRPLAIGHANASYAEAGSFPRCTSYTPYGMVNFVDDLWLAESTPPRLSWTYCNKGDYDLNGMVNVSDLTPIGVYYGLTWADPRWLLAAAADGDGNGMITIADVTPIGQYFGGTIIGYEVWGADDPAGTWAHLGDATVANRLIRNPLRPRFVVELPSLDYEYYKLWPYDNSDSEGWWSNIAVPGQSEPRKMSGLESIWKVVF